MSKVKSFGKGIINKGKEVVKKVGKEVSKTGKGIIKLGKNISKGIDKKTGFFGKVLKKFKTVSSGVVSIIKKGKTFIAKKLNFKLNFKKLNIKNKLTKSSLKKIGSKLMPFLKLMKINSNKSPSNVIKVKSIPAKRYTTFHINTKNFLESLDDEGDFDKL
jgi:hypothetical protein